MDEETIVYENYNPEEEPLREALCTLGNGYFATRAAHESSHAGNNHYPGTYLAGGYNRMKSEVEGRIVENEDLVNWPNWLFLTFRLPDGNWFSPDNVKFISYKQNLYLRKGLLERTMRFSDSENRETVLISRRLINMKFPHLGSLQWILIPQNWSDEILIHSALDATVINNGVERYRSFNGRHLEFIRSGKTAENGIFLEVHTCQSHIRMAQAARTLLFDGEGSKKPERIIQKENYIAHETGFKCKKLNPVRIEKTVAIYTSRDNAISAPVYEACRDIENCAGFDKLLKFHIRSWEHIWNRCNIDFENDNKVLSILHLHIFHLMQTASPNTVDLDAGVPPRGLHGEAYRGHIMWDELFIFPFLNLRLPFLTRTFLMYRYRRLKEARRAAHQEGFGGAMFPWMSGSNGREESQKIHLNPLSKRWVPDNTCLQRHVNAAIAYNVWQYYQSTDDKEFLYFYGAEMLLEIAKFWSSVVSYNQFRKRYEIHGVIGPDEYHTAYPDSDSPGINNNAYTNIMAVWVLLRAIEVLEILDENRTKEILDNLSISNEEIERWKHISTNMFIPVENSFIWQFEGYETLKELDWKSYHKEYGDNIRLDRILENENDTINNYKACKQADVLMLFYLFSSDELKLLLNYSGYNFNPESIPEMIEYYHNRTSHGSTLSRLVLSWVLSRADRNHSWHIFKHALLSDFLDVQGGTTPEGIHLGAMAGTIDIIQRCYTGIETRNDVLWFNPCLPLDVKSLSFRIRYRSHFITVSVNQKELTLYLEEGLGNPVKLGFGGEIHLFKKKQKLVFSLDKTCPA